MSRAEYMIIHSEYLPTEIRARYYIDRIIASDRYVYIKPTKGMYGLKQLGIID